MALETWLVKVKTKLSKGLDTVRHHNHHHHAPAPAKKTGEVGFLSFEMAGVMSKLLHLWRSLSDHNVTRLRNDSIRLEGVRKIVSNDDALLLGLACAELADTLRTVANSVSRLTRRCQSEHLRSFDRIFREFADSGVDPHRWIMSPKEMEVRCRKMDRCATATATLYKDMDELAVMENGLRKAMLADSAKEHKIYDLQQKILWKREGVKHLKHTSLWSRNLDSVASMLARSVFTVLARIKLVFGVGVGYPATLPRSLSAAVHPSDQLTTNEGKCESHDQVVVMDFFGANSRVLEAPGTTLGAAGLALHYSNLVIVMEKMIRSPQLVGVDARDDLYAMLPASVRWSLRRRLRGVGFGAATDSGLAGEWREALGRVLAWLSPLAHNMIRWQSERSFEHHNSVPKTNVMLFQTLFFANRTKTEAAITELLVGLNYIWRFEREMTANALFHTSTYNNNGTSDVFLIDNDTHQNPAQPI